MYNSYKWYGRGEEDVAKGGYNALQRLGRDTWIMWTAGNQKFFRLGTHLAGSLGVSVEYLRLIDSRDRATRFERLGLVNEPNCRQATKPDKYGFWIDEWDGDPYPDSYPDTKIYGEPTGIVGLRKYPNTSGKFDPNKWNPQTDPERYFKNPDKVEPPYYIGMTCCFCHMGFNPIKPPADPVNPKWENLAANLGNQYLAEGRVFFGSGKVVYGDQNGGKGLGDEDFFHHLGETQQRGTSETSRLSYDFINNPNVINSVFYLESRPKFKETLNAKVIEALTAAKLVDAGGTFPAVHHVLRDGADSQGIPIASIRVYVNIGMFGEYWITKLWNPLKPDEPQKPFDMSDATAQSEDWRATMARLPGLENYLATYEPMRLEKAPGAVEAGYVIPDSYRGSTDPDKAAKWKLVERGMAVFAEKCAECHSSKGKPLASASAEEKKVFYQSQVMEPDFLDGNVLTDDVPYKVSELKTNAARALATNATAGHVWDQFSSPEYKAREASDPLTLYNPADESKPRVWKPPGGGRGYYRTSSLVAIWATAPFLHNNSVGAFPDELGFKPSEWPSVKARVATFDYAIKRLLNPKLRKGKGSMKVTTTDSFVYLRLKSLESVATGGLDAFGVPTPQLGKLKEEKDRLLKKLDVFGLGEKLPKPDTAQIPAFGFKVPEGTPINLLANLHVSNAAKAAPFFVKYAFAKGVLKLDSLEREAMDELLKLSEYPDLIEDHGHEYGSELSSEDQAALIEYLKKM
jgi:hypothetical protein